MPRHMLTTDILVVGGGTAGCVVAGRLSDEFPDLSITVVERGKDSVGMTAVDRPLEGLTEVFKGSDNYRYYPSGEADAVGGRALVVPTANLLGGGTAVNWLTHQNAAASDFDDFQQPGWSFKELKPLLFKSQKCEVTADPDIHGPNGAMPITFGGHLSKVGAELDIALSKVDPSMKRLNDTADAKHGHGYGRGMFWIGKDGKRSTAVKSYVRNREHPNIRIIVNKVVDKLVFDGDRVVGAECCDAPLDSHEVTGALTITASRQVVLCAGALATPSILERSGVGDPNILERAGVEVKLALPGVGREYHDHPIFFTGFSATDLDGIAGYVSQDQIVVKQANTDWERDGRGILATSAGETIFKLRPDKASVSQLGPGYREMEETKHLDKPDKPLLTGAFLTFFNGDPKLLGPQGHGLTTACWLNYPMSKGQIHIKDTNPHSFPRFETGMLSHPSDISCLVFAYKRIREIARHMPSFRGEVASAQPSFPVDSKASLAEIGAELESHDPIIYNSADDEAIANWIRRTAETCWHSNGTAPMRARDNFGVVDERLNVHGLEGIKIADMSILPSDCGTNLASVALMIGEKCASLISEELRASQTH